MEQSALTVEGAESSFGRSQGSSWYFSFLQLFVSLISLLSWPLWPILLRELFKEVQASPSFTGVLLVIFWFGVACIFVWAPCQGLYLVRANIRDRRLPFLVVNERGVDLFFPSRRFIAWSRLLSVRWYTIKGVPRLGFKVPRNGGLLKRWLGLQTRTIWIATYSLDGSVTDILQAIRSHPRYQGERF